MGFFLDIFSGHGELMRKVMWMTMMLSPCWAQVSLGSFNLLTEQSRTAFTVQGAGARAMGTGGAFIAVSDDASAVSFNPAGLAQLLRPEASLVIQGFTRSRSFRGATGTDGASPTTFEDTSNTDRHVQPSFLSFAMPWKRDGLNTVFLLSYQRVFDFTYLSSVKYLATASEGSTLQAISQQVKQSGGLDAYSAALGAELSPRILVGASLNYWTGSPRFSSISQRNTSGISAVFDSNLSQAAEYRGLNVNLGLIWRSDWVNLGFVYRSPFSASYTFSDSYTHVDIATGVLQTDAEPSVDSTVKWPETFGWGIAVHPVGRWLVTADWSRTPWSRAKFAAPGTPYDGLNWFDFERSTVTKDTMDFRTGVEWIAWMEDSVIIPLRIGAFREPQPVVDRRTGIQRVLQGWTAGLGIKFKNLTLDLAVKKEHDQRHASRYNTDAPVGGVASIAFGTETLDEQRFYLSMIYQLDAAKVRQALGWVFVGN